MHKEGPLAPDEWALMMKHPLLGLEFLRDDSVSPRVEVDRALAPRALGRLRLPRRAGQDEASMFSRIAAVADVYDAVTSERFHAHAVPVADGVDLIRGSSGTAFDPLVVDAFLGVVAAS